MSRGVEAISAKAPAVEPVRFEVVRAQTEEPDTRALFLSRALLAPEHARRETIHGIMFDKHFGTLLLGLRQRKIMTKLMSRGQQTELKEAGFRPSDNMHITVLRSKQAELLVDALDGQRKHLARVEAEAHQIDWRWRPVGEPYSFQKKPSNSLKIVQNIECPGVEEFYGRLEGELPGLELERDPLHVTLMYRKQKGRLEPEVGGISMREPASTLVPRLRLVEPGEAA